MASNEMWTARNSKIIHLAHLVFQFETPSILWFHFRYPVIATHSG